MIRLQKDKMARSIERSKAVRPMVRRIADRTYSVSGSKGGQYTVQFIVRGNVKLGECDCKAGQAGMPCFHLAAAAAVNIALHSAYSRPSESPKASAPSREQLIAEIERRWAAKFPRYPLSHSIKKQFNRWTLAEVPAGYLSAILQAWF